MLQLCYSPGTASMIPHLLLREMGLPFELRLFDTEQQAHRSAEYLRLNPNGQIPTLIDDDLVIYETAAICLHLADQHPAAGMAPALGSVERAHFYKWLMWLNNTLQTTLIVYFYPDRWADDEAAIAQVQQHAETKVGTLLDLLDAELARHGGEWLQGDRYSVLDAYTFVLCRWTRRFARPARDLPHLGPYLRRILARPATQQMLAGEGLPEPWI